MDINQQIVGGSRGGNSASEAQYDSGRLGKSIAVAPRTPIQQVDAELAYHQQKVADLQDLRKALEENPGVEKVLNALSKLNR